MKSRRTLQDRLSSRGVLLGLFQRHPHVMLAELAAFCRYDFLVLDDEHGLFSEGDHLETVRALSFSSMAVFVRLRGQDTHAVGRYLDLGVDGLMVPNVSTAEQARKLVRAMEYPPAGTRGFGPSAHRVTRYGMDMVEHVKFPRGTAALLLIIESALGVANVEDILAVSGVDGVIVGPADLTADLGCPGEFSSPAYADALSRIERGAVTHSKILGTAPHAGYPVEVLLARGHRLLIIGSDTALIREAMTAQLEQATSLCELYEKTKKENS